MYSFCSITAVVTCNVGALPSPWLSALANPLGQEVPLAEALVRAEDVWSHRTAGAHPQGDWNLLSLVTCGGMARKKEWATYLISMIYGHIRKHRKLLLPSSYYQGAARLPHVVSQFHIVAGSKLIHFVLKFREDKSRSLEFL